MSPSRPCRPSMACREFLEEAGRSQRRRGRRSSRWSSSRRGRRSARGARRRRGPRRAGRRGRPGCSPPPLAPPALLPKPQGPWRRRRESPPSSRARRRQEERRKEAKAKQRIPSPRPSSPPASFAPWVRAAVPPPAAPSPGSRSRPQAVPGSAASAGGATRGRRVALPPLPPPSSGDPTRGPPHASSAACWCRRWCLRWDSAGRRCLER